LLFNQLTFTFKNHHGNHTLSSHSSSNLGAASWEQIRVTVAAEEGIGVTVASEEGIGVSVAAEEGIGVANEGSS
jgi:hypothetical protein